MRGTQNPNSSDKTAVEELAGYHRCLDRLAHTNIIGDQ
jgi:hypothetical protein